MENNILEIFKLNKKWAVIGVTNDKEKYGYQIYNKLKQNNKIVYGINPKYNNIDDNIIYPDLESINDSIDIVVFVVNPGIGIKYLDDIINKNIKTIWLQPGTESNELVLKAKNSNINVIEACVLVVSTYIDNS